MPQIQVNSLIITAAAYKVILIIDSVPYPILTGETLSWNNAREEETIYAIGQEDPIGQKRNAAKYTGKLSMQNGEMAAILQLAGYTESTQIVGATLAVASTNALFNRVWGQVNINTESVDVKAKDKQTLINMDWTALSVS